MIKIPFNLRFAPTNFNKDYARPSLLLNRKNKFVCILKFNWSFVKIALVPNFNYFNLQQLVLVKVTIIQFILF